MAVQASNDTPLSKFSDAVEQLTKIGAAFVTVTYILGFTVVSLHLGAFGIFNLDLFSLQYLLAGLWLFVPPALILVMGVASFALYLQLQPPPKELAWAKMVFSFSVVAALAAFLIYALYQFLSRIIGPQAAVNLSRILLFSGLRVTLVMVGLVVYLTLTWLLMKPLVAWAKSRAGLMPYLLSLTLGLFPVLMIGIYVLLFVRDVYPKLPATIGGGQPIVVRLLIEPDETPTQPGLELLHEAASNDVMLIIETNRSYIVTSSVITNTMGAAAVLDIPKDSVQGLVIVQPAGLPCDPSYPTLCIPSPPPDINCASIKFVNFPVLSPDPHNFDTDGNGIGCEAQ
jgi:hypothetical protein